MIKYTWFDTVDYTIVQYNRFPSSTVSLEQRRSGPPLERLNTMQYFSVTPLPDKTYAFVSIIGAQSTFLFCKRFKDIEKCAIMYKNVSNMMCVCVCRVGTIIISFYPYYSFLYC